MTTLSSPQVRDLLDALFADNERTMNALHEERSRLRAAGFGPGSPEFTAAARAAHMAVTPEIGQLLYLLVRARQARTVVEFGTSFGVSTLHLAAALRDNGAGILVTTEIEPTKVQATRRTLVEAGLSDLVEILQGDAVQTLAARRPRPVDLLFLDGANHLYLDVLAVVEPDLAPSALVVADNADASDYRDHVRADERFVSVSAGERVEVSLLAEPRPAVGGSQPRD